MGSGQLEEVHDVEFDETQGSQNEATNLDDVRGAQLEQAMRNMDIGDIRPMQSNDDEDHPIITSVQVENEQDSVSHDEAQMQDQEASVSHPSHQVQVLQPNHIARDHPVDHIIGDIESGVQTRSRLATICQHYSFVSFKEPINIDDAMKDNDWIIVMQEELNNFKRNEVWELVERPKDHNVNRTK